MKPNFFDSYLEKLHASVVINRNGEVASYIPELSKADPGWCGIALVTVDGHVYQVGDTAQPFTIQSISKVFSYGMALQSHGVEGVLKKVGVEPSGEAFNSISLEPGTGRPMNPMINAGAIATTNLVGRGSREERLKQVLAAFRLYSGRPLTVDEAVYNSEKATGHRNRAIAHMLVNYNIIEGDPESSLDLYFKQCSILVTCRDLAVMAATLANQGVNPITGIRAIEANLVPRMLSIMASCGMYDYSGDWIYNVGMPAKSGVGGGIMAVLPGRFGLAVFSPPLDAKGNSVRGIEVCRSISSDFQFHMLHVTKAAVGSVIRAKYDLATVSSKRTRPPEATRHLAKLGHQATIFELAGDIDFASAELILSEAAALHDDLHYLVLDFRRVSSVDAAAVYLFAGLISAMSVEAKQLLFTCMGNILGFEKHLKEHLPKVRETGLLDQKNLDHALEWCEDQILAKAGYQPLSSVTVPLAAHYICHDLTHDELAFLDTVLVTRSFAQGQYLCREGDEDSVLHLILSGDVSIVLRGPEKESRRVATLSAGTAVGELAMLSRAPRSADVLADTAVMTRSVDCSMLEHHEDSLAWGVRMKLIKNSAIYISERLRKANLEIRSLMH